MGKIFPIKREKQPPLHAKIAIALPTHDYAPMGFSFDLACLVRDTGSAIHDMIRTAEEAGRECQISFGIEMSAGTYVHSARQELIEDLLGKGVTHILWLDTDMRFPSDALVRLMNHDLPMVGINYAKRKVPSDFVAIKCVGWGPDDRSEKLITHEYSTGLEEVEAIGFGMVLMQTSALANMPDPKKEPWFWFKWMEDKQQQAGEDVWFCKLFRDSGQRIFVDHDLSKECGHIGQFTYKLDHVLLTRPEAVAV